MFFYLVLTPISTYSGIWSTGNTRKYQQIDIYIYQCETRALVFVLVILVYVLLSMFKYLDMFISSESFLF